MQLPIFILGVIHKEAGGNSVLLPLTISFAGDQDEYTLSGSLNTTTFCKTWASAMGTAASSNALGAIALKQVIHAHELKVMI